MYKTLKRICTENIYLFIGLLLGLYISAFISNTFDVQCKNSQPHNADLLVLKNETAQEITNTVSNVKPVAKLAIPKKPQDNSKKTKLIRPRYYSTELGIREKVFLGVFTTEERVNTQAVHLNKTVGHLVDKIKFFITAQYKLKTKFNLTGLVGFTDARTKYRPFQVVKYVGDSFAQDYDYYVFTTDYTFINVHRLRDVLGKISVGMDVYLGTKVPDASYCNLDAGIVISNSVLRAMRSRLDWCIMNVVSDDHSENLGRCVYHSLGMQCQDFVQGESLPSWKLKHFQLNEHLLKLTKRPDFTKAVTVYPVMQKDDFYLLNAYYLKQRLSMIKQQIDELSSGLGDSWPPGHRAGAKPATRFDLPRQYYFNMSHMFFPDDFTNIRAHTEVEMLDIENIIEEVKAKVALNHSKELLYRRLVNGYRTFDLSRGMDYTLDLGFRDLTTGKEVIKRFQVCKPLGNVEFIPVPYVTENTRVTILLTIEEGQQGLAMDFLRNYSAIMERKEKTFLMLVLLYQYNSDSKSPRDIFGEIKNFALKTSNKYRNDDTKIAWVSIRLPQEAPGLLLKDNSGLRFAVVDLALRKVGLESLVLVLDVQANVTVDFLNRVRMNTIPGFQVFSPIPFRQYNPRVTQVPGLDVHKNIGHFDRDNYKYISFYGRDYVQARKKYQHVMPLIRLDGDIGSILGPQYAYIGNIFEMFVKYNEKLHCMRATEMSLKVRYYEEDEQCHRNLFLGNNAQLAKILLGKQMEIPELQGI